MTQYDRLTAKKEDRYWEQEEFWQSAEEPSYEKIEEIYTRLAELEDKIDNGTLIELPCKVGDTVYEVFKEHKPPFIQETTIEKIVITEKGFKLRLSRNSVYETAISSLGRTIFLTEAEAEAKLKELKEKQK